MLNLHEETRCTVFEIVIIFCAVIVVLVGMAVVFDYAVEKTEVFERKMLDAQITPEQRADVMGGGR